MMGELWFLMLAGIWAYGWWLIVRKAGYSGWHALLTLIPVLNVVWFLWFALSTYWPVHRQRALARVLAGSTADEEAQLALLEAASLEKRGAWDEAIEAYAGIAETLGHSDNGRYAADAATRLRQRTHVL